MESIFDGERPCEIPSIKFARYSSQADAALYLYRESTQLMMIFSGVLLTTCLQKSYNTHATNKIGIKIQMEQITTTKVAVGISLQTISTPLYYTHFISNVAIYVCVLIKH